MIWTYITETSASACWPYNLPSIVTSAATRARRTGGPHGVTQK